RSVPHDHLCALAHRDDDRAPARALWTPRDLGARAHRALARRAQAMILQIDRISLSFGGLKAVSEFSLALTPGSLQGLIGPNGAGKTTVFNLLTGVYQPEAGTIRLDGVELNG